MKSYVNIFARALFALLVGILIIPGSLISSNVYAQAAQYTRPAGNGILHFQTKLGSFKVLHIGKELVTGTLTFTFRGSVLVSGATHPPIVKGNVRLEYQNKKHQKLGYHGVGSMTITGPFESVEWFGSDMSAIFVGRGKVRLSGEFDKNLNTGTYWTTDPKNVQYWPANSVSDVSVPNYVTPASVAGTAEAPMSRKQYDESKKKGGK